MLWVASSDRPRSHGIFTGLTRFTVRHQDSPPSHQLPLQTNAGQPANGSSLQPANADSLSEGDLTPDPQILVALVRSILAQSGGERMFARDLVARLNSLPEHPWSSRANGKPMTERSLACRLRPLGIQSRTVRIAGTAVKGYVVSDFAPGTACSNLSTEMNHAMG